MDSRTPTSFTDTVFEYDPCLLKAYLDGDWDAFSAVSDALTQPKFLNQCREKVGDEREEDSVS